MKKMLFLSLAFAGLMLGGCELCSWFKCATSSEGKSMCCGHDKKAEVVSPAEAEKTADVSEKNVEVSVNRAEGAVEEAV